VVAALEEAGADPPLVRVESVDHIEREGGHAAKLKVVMSER
jgi:hypothetical protein